MAGRFDQSDAERLILRGVLNIPRPWKRHGIRYRALLLSISDPRYLLLEIERRSMTTLRPALDDRVFALLFSFKLRGLDSALLVSSERYNSDIFRRPE